MNYQEKLTKFIKENDYITKINDDIILCSTDKIKELLLKLQNRELFSFDILIDLFANDLSEYKDKDKYRYEIIYNLLSITENKRLMIKILITEEEAANKKLDSVCSIFKNANWYEREAFDMFGIYFKNHPDLRRILTDYGFEGYPLRKDFPLSGKYQLRYDEKQKKIIKEDVRLEQEYRDFNFDSDLISPVYQKLPGDEKNKS